MKRPLIALIGLQLALPVAAADAAAQPSTYLHAWLGQSTDDGWKASEVQSGDSLLGDLGTLP